ncbi:hypothetical protein E6Q11_03840 [Candidatus Dojkabacteria bacterium]|uniref:Pyridoxamine 5'-phosphate oxidase putative domain-containing protein n=1 Tax=Candidatus Dojkabacteria bacterium TaxID=2099670 RepID=A0A5C7J6U4_9BACT|nr:MAG: hypothetical protein E6Q11_03840 [Candidatus Dojkabacteria bacterium]
MPDPVIRAIYDDLGYPKAEINCQVATVFGSTPHIRTMKLYDICDGDLVFCTFTDKQKWLDLKSNTSCSVCFFFNNWGQIIAEGNVCLSSNRHGQEQTEFYWQKLLPCWRQAYLSGTNSKSIPDAFGVIKVVPNRWEILRINHDDYFSSIRFEAVWKSNSWHFAELKPC